MLFTNQSQSSSDTLKFSTFFSFCFCSCLKHASLSHFKAFAFCLDFAFHVTTLLFIFQNPDQIFLSILTSSLRQESMSVLEANLFLPYCLSLFRYLPHQIKYLKAKNHVISFLYRPNIGSAETSQVLNKHLLNKQLNWVICKLSGNLTLMQDTKHCIRSRNYSFIYYVYILL